MEFLSQLNVANLRRALLSPDEPSCRRFCTNTARLVAAFYLGLPLFEAETYPTLFQWTQLAKEGPCVSREEMAAALPAEFSARLPVVLLIFCCHDLEAVLYADHFSDRRSSLLLRVLVDRSLGLSLTDEYVADWLLGEVARQSAAVPPPVETLCDQLLPAVLELDIVLCRNYIRSLEIHLVDEIELLFAQLPLHSTHIDQLPRPPVYLSPSNTASSPESVVISRIHTLLRMTLSSLHITNRISSELRRTINVCSEPDATFAGGRPLLVRLVVIILSLLYRDSFSLAVHEQWTELPEVAMKYKALIEGEEEDAIGRWHSLADEQDMEHVTLFSQFVRNTYEQQTTLPPLEASTRELWNARICTESPESARESPDWVSGVLQVEKKVSSEAWQQMQFISGRWWGLSLPDPNLIPLRLHVTPDVLCRQLAAPIKLPQSAREQMNSPREERFFIKRSELLEEYTLKAKEDLARRKQETRRKCNTHREPRYMKSTVNSWHIQKIASSQSGLLREVEAERLFLDSSQKKSPPSFPSSSLTAYPCSSTSSSPSVKSAGTREDAIRNDIRLLNEKIENIGRMLAEVPLRPQTSPPRSPSVVSVEQSPLVYNQMPVASSPPAVEKLDFSLLSPNPSARQPRVPTPDSIGEEERVEEGIESLSMDTAKSLPQTNENLGLLRPQSERLPLLHYEKKPSQVIQNEPSMVVRAATTERAVQTAGMTLGEMKPMTRQDISTLYRTRQT